MLTRARSLLNAYFAAQLLLTIIAISFIAGFWAATAMAIGMVKAAAA
ncbi:hypothetical protein [Sphingomonas sp. URHD0057]|nr:hypothetical protein [Sphingomonas sp. URHD0057]